MKHSVKVVHCIEVGNGRLQFVERVPVSPELARSHGVVIFVSVLDIGNDT
jgi:hypothetical protein